MVMAASVVGGGKEREKRVFLLFFLPITVANDSHDFRAMMTRTSFPIFFFSSLNLRFFFFFNYLYFYF